MISGIPGVKLVASEYIEKYCEVPLKNPIELVSL
jgi:hypothetical protein